ncbi:hypothetical protein MMC12_006024 [Toensbergia leucococca]|nr:hypothetical protein [Toensbergia leucococca]
MVQLEEVEDTELDQPQPGPTSFDEDDDADFTDTDSSLSTTSLPSSPPAETSLERLLALRDMLPPSTRRRISSASSALTGYVKTGLGWGGKTAWVVSASAFMLGVPWLMAYVEEQQIVEMEREQRAREVGAEVITPGATSLGQQGKAAL